MRPARTRVFVATVEVASGFMEFVEQWSDEDKQALMPMERVATAIPMMWQFMREWPTLNIFEQFALARPIAEMFDRALSVAQDAQADHPFTRHLHEWRAQFQNDAAHFLNIAPANRVFVLPRDEEPPEDERGQERAPSSTRCPSTLE